MTGSDLTVDMMPAELGQLDLHLIAAQSGLILHYKGCLVASCNADLHRLHRTRATEDQTSRQKGVLAVDTAHCQRQVSCDAD